MEGLYKLSNNKIARQIRNKFCKENTSTRTLLIIQFSIFHIDNWNCLAVQIMNLFLINYQI